MNLLNTIQEAAFNATGVKLFRADQLFDIQEKPYATYKIISDSKGVGRETVDLIDLPEQLDEHVETERTVTVSFNVYGQTHDQAKQKATILRRWFENNRSAEFCEEYNIAFASISDVGNRTTFLVDSYDEKYGFDVSVRYIDTDQYEIDYFDKVEYEIEIEKE